MKKSIIGIISLIVFVYFTSVFVLAEDNTESARVTNVDIVESSIENSAKNETGVAVENLESLEIMAAATETTASTDVVDAKNEELYSTGYNPKTIQYDNIDLQSGAIHIVEPDLTLPGKNGLDVNIYRMYNSHKTDYILYSEYEDNKYDLKYYQYHYDTVDAEGNIINNILYIRYNREEDIVDSFKATETSINNKVDHEGEYIINYEDLEISETGVLLERNKNVSEEYIRFEEDGRVAKAYDCSRIKTVDLQYGWDIVVPTLTSTYRVYDSEDEIYYHDAVFTDEYGKSYSVEFEIKKTDERRVVYSTPQIESIDYSITIEEAEADNCFNLYITTTTGYTYSLENVVLHSFIDYIFNTKKDRYGNTITYAKTGNSVQITDTYGRIITVDKSGITVFDGEEIQKAINYERETVYDPDRDPYGKLTYFQENIFTVSESVAKDEQGNFVFEKTEYVMYPREIVPTGAWPIATESIDQYLIKSITYPAGAKIKYEYPNEGTVEKDILSLDGGDFEHYYYLYNPSKYSIYEKNDLGEYEFKVSYEYTFDEKIENEQDRTTTEVKRVYDEENAYYKTEYKHDTYERLSKVIKYGYPETETAVLTEQYTYDSDYYDSCYMKLKFYETQAPIKIIERDGYLTQTSEDRFYYNGKKQVIKTHSGGHFHTYAYDENYGFITEETYSKDFDTQIIIRNTKTDDGKSIAKTSIYELVNGVETLVSEVYYTYNTDGTVATETVYPSEGVEHRTVYSYTYEINSGGNYTGAYSITKTLYEYLEELVGVEYYSKREVYEYDEFGNLIRYRDSEMNDTYYTRDLKGRITEETYPDNTHKYISYNIAENSVTVTDANGNATVSDYTPMGYIERIYIPGENETTLYEYEYDGFFRLKEKKTYIDDEQYILNEYTYSLSGDILSDKLSEVNGNTETYVDTTRYNYEKINTLIERYDEDYGTFTSNGKYEYVVVFDDFAEVKDVDNDVTIKYISPETTAGDVNIVNISGFNRINVSADGYALLKDYELGVGFKGDNLIMRTYYDDPQRLSLETEYDGHGNVVRETYYIIDGETSEKQIQNEILYYYDFAGNLVKTLGGQALLDGEEYSTKTDYDALGRIVKEYMPMLEGQTEPDCTTYEYDNIGRLVKTTDVNDNSTTYRYDAIDVFVYTTYPFDSTTTKRVESVNDNLGNVRISYEQINQPGQSLSYRETEYEYDAMSRVITQKRNDGTRDIYTQYGYDNVGNVLKAVTGQTSKIENVFTSIISGDVAVTEYEYDRFGNVTKQTDAMGYSETYEYDLLGRLVSKTDRNGKTITTTYNVYGSPLTVSIPTEVLTTNTYNSDNMLISTSDGTTTIYYEYDALGRLTKETNDNIIKVYSYDADGNRTSMSITKDGIEEMAANYTYDNRGRVTSVNFGENMFAAAEYEYYSDNKLKKETRYGVVTEYEYNAAGLNTLTKTTYNGVIMDCNMLTYDLAGNAIIRDVSGAPNIAAGIMLYTYDKLGQMLTERCDYGGVYGFSNTYAYDTRGNRTEVRRTGEYTGNTASAYGYDNNNRLKEEYQYDYTIDKHYFRMYTYDKNGNVVRIDDLSAYGYEEVLTKQYRIYSYDDFGRLKYIQTEAMSEEALPGYTPATELETQAMSLNADFNTIDYRQFAYEESEEERLMREQAIERAMEVWRMRNGITEEETEEVIGEEPVELISKTSEEISSEEITENNSAETMEETEISEEVFESEVSIDETEETTTEEVVAENLIELEIPETEIVSEEISEENTYELQKEVLVEDTVETEEMVSEEISEELILEAETEEILVEETENELAEESVAVVDKLTEVSLTDESTSELTFPITTYIINYTYNPDGTRASKSVDLFADVEITEHIWDNGYIVMDYNMETQYEIEPESGELLKYYRGIHLIVNDINYVIYDDMGNIVGEVGMADVPGKVTEYDAFGNAYVSTQSPFGYRGEYTDYETGYVYLRNRYYNPETGRFITEDPIRDGLNWYAYCNNNPIMFVDPWGLIPTPDEAAAMAEHIYDYNKDSSKYNRTVEGWRLIDVWYGRESMKMGFYIRDDDNWENPSEYAVVFRGSIVEFNGETINVWKNNIEQNITSKSADMWDAINFSKGFVASIGDTEVTFIGHSKGGAEALSAAVATNKNAIVFNPAEPNLNAYSLSATDYTGTAISYVVKGEVLNTIFGEPGVGDVKYLKQEHKTYDIIPGLITAVNSVRNHLVDSVIWGLQQEGK